jgi:hypothetical protein
MGKKTGPILQRYPREDGSLLSQTTLFPPLKPKMENEAIEKAVDLAFDRCFKKKSGDRRDVPATPEELVEMCIDHLRTRSDPILSPYFVNYCNIDSLFELDAVSHEMQRHRMTMGVFYQFLLLELMKIRWNAFDGSREGDIVADIETPNFGHGLRLYMSVKKSKDTVGGQDVPGVITRLESVAKEEKNLTRPYLCVLCIATPQGQLKGYEDRQVKSNNQGSPYSVNCEQWGPGFIFPYLTGRSAMDVYLIGIKKVAQKLPFYSMIHRNTCSALLKKQLAKLGLLGDDGKIVPEKFLEFTCGGK